MAVEIEGGGSFTPCPAGMHPAWCYAVVDIGTQPQMHMGVLKQQKKVRIQFELPHQKTQDGKPLTTGCTLTASLAESAILRKFLKGWRGRDFTPEELKKFNLSAVIGKACQLIVVHNPKKDGSGVMDSIQAIQPAPKGADGKPSPLPVLQNKLIDFSIKDWSHEAYSAMPAWLQKKIAQSPEGAAKVSPNQGGASTVAAGADQPPDDSIPF